MQKSPLQLHAKSQWESTLPSDFGISESVKIGVEASSILSVSEYRELLNDTGSTDEQIAKRLEYLESLSRDIIRKELRQYAKQATDKKH